MVMEVTGSPSVPASAAEAGAEWCPGPETAVATVAEPRRGRGKHGCEYGGLVSLQTQMQQDAASLLSRSSSELPRHVAEFDWISFLFNSFLVS
jgi:hypothetical protein